MLNKKYILIIIYLIVPSLLGNIATSQKLKFSHLSLANKGLSNSIINCIAQDSTGFIWIGTPDGLNRFDGVKINTYSHRPSDENSLANNVINDISCQGDNVWICTYSGVDRFSLTDATFHHIPIFDNNKMNEYLAVFKFCKDNKGIYYIATRKGIYIYNESKNIFQKLIINNNQYEYLNNAEITYIIQDREGIFWIGTKDKGAFTLSLSNMKIAEIKHNVNGNNTLQNNKIFCIYEDKDNDKWIGTNEGLYSLNHISGSIKRYLYEPGRLNWLPHISVNQIFGGKNHELWLATNNGLSIFNKEKITFQNYYHNDFDENSIGNNSVHCIFKDMQKNIWVGSGENDVNIIKSQSIEFENFKCLPNQSNSLNYGYILSVILDRNENIWIGTNGKGINLYEAKTGKFKYIIPPIATQSGKQAASILSLLEDKEGKIWIGSYLGGVVIYNPKTGVYTSYAHDPNDKNSLSNNNVNQIFQDSKGKIWLSTEGGINIFDPITKTFSKINSGTISSDICTIIYEDLSHNMWIGTFYGLNKYNTQTGKNEIFLHNENAGSISSNVIYSICQDTKGRLWFGTDFGLDLYNPKTNTFKVYTTDNGLPNNMIKGILEDSRGYLWLSTNKGLARFSPEQIKSTNYTTQDGLSSMFFYHGAYFKDNNGNLYFGSTEGLTYFNPDKIKNNQYETPLVFTDFYIFNKPVVPGPNSVLKTSISKSKKIQLNYDQSFVAIEFASLNFVNPDKDSYSYYLEGFDRQWNNIGNQRIASYTNLPPGNYIFYVKATNENEYETHASINIIVKPPFWKTYYAYTLYTFLIFALLYFIYNYNHQRNVYKHNLLVERMEKEKAIEINQAKIRFFINVSHDFKTPLTLIVSPLEKLISFGNVLSQIEVNNLYHLIYRNTLRLSRLINQVMDLRKIDTGNIKLFVTENEIISFINEIAISFEEHARNHSIDFSVQTKFESLKVWFDIDKIEKVFYNLLSNAFRYTSDGKKIMISIDYINDEDKNKINSEINSEGYVKISVIDHGRGIPEDLHEKIFTRFYQVHTETLANPASSGIGLSLVKEFIEMHNGIITVNSKPKQGSTFSVILPLGKQQFKEEDFASEQNVDLTIPQKEELIQAAKDETIESIETHQTNERRKYKVLIVEDNFELRKFLCDSLKQKYNIFEASNGKDAYDIISENLPDLVISDVMMPVMNGVELCKAIKTDIKTSHIPIILLTVLNNISNQIEGFETGADDYITKPFNLFLLEARIINIIETRKKIIRKFVDELKPDSKNYSHNVLDEKFMQRAMDLIEKNISNYEFTAEDFAVQLSMSRSNLHIKLKALTNQSATEFIRLIRLKKSIGLLALNQYNISEVSYMVGFNSISYFNRCFKQQFGLTPTEYINKGKII